MSNPLSFASNFLLDLLFPRKRSILHLEGLQHQHLRSVLPKARRFAHIPNINPLFDYSHPYVRELVWEIKYKENRRLAAAIARLLAEDLMDELSELSLFEGNQSPLLVPIPMSKERRKERGYNQTETLCEMTWRSGLANHTIYVPNLLSKTRHTASQTSLSRAERLKNLEQSIKVTNSALLKDRHVILVDDVITTGATVSVARDVLLNAGAKSVSVYAIAH